MKKILITFSTVTAKGLVVFSLISIFILTVGSPAVGQSGNTGTSDGKGVQETAKEQDASPLQQGANMDKGTYTQQDSTRGKTHGNAGTTGAIQDTTRNGERTGTSGNRTGVYGNTGGRLDSSRTDGQQMSNTGNRNDTLMGPTQGKGNTGMGTQRSGNQSGTNSNRSGNKATKGTRNGNNNSGSRNYQ